MTKNTHRHLRDYAKHYTFSSISNLVLLAMSIRRQVTLSHTLSVHTGMHQISGGLKYTPSSIQYTGQMIKHYLKFKHQLCQSVTVIFHAYNGPGHKKTCLRGFRQSETQTILLNYRD